ncbi:MAG: hypothetical protein GC151_05785 [Betaproteobacteria bacterium]|nr:hypothetical protein [Betaproteobacteria bacterium]
MMATPRTGPSLQTGFALPTAIFLLVVLAALGVYALTVSGLQHGTEALDVGGTRAYLGARAGIEWGIAQVLDPHDADAGLAASPPRPPGCFGATTLPLGEAFDGAQVVVTCARTATTESDRQIAVYALTARVDTGGGAFPVAREVSATVSRCVDPGGVAPRYACP